jgi:thiamine biosynthesis lipoprotein
VTVTSAGSIGTRTVPALGTFASLLVTDPDRLDQAWALFTGELHAIDVACSRFRSDSGLWQVNHAWGRPVQVSPLLAEALATALTAARLTDGDVDPTCGQSLARLGYNQDFAQARQHTGGPAPSPAPAPGWHIVEFDQDRRVVRVPDGVMLDLGATAKALAADRAATRIAAAAGCGALVNLGGDIRVAGEPPGGGWHVGIVDDAEFETQSPHREPTDSVMIRDGGVATSSTLVRSWRRGEVSLHHIIVPSTGLPADSCWRTASVAAATCVDANTASTAAILRGERAVGWLEALRLPGRLVHQDGTTVTTGGWAAAGTPISAAGLGAGA